MKTYDLIKVLRNEVPDRAKTVRVMTQVGGVCLFVALWNVAMSFLYSEITQKFYGLTYLCTGYCTTGILFLFSAYALKLKASWGKIISQLSIIVLALLLIMTVFLIAKSSSNFSGSFGKGILSSSGLMFIIFSVILLAHYLILAYYGIHYLNRLDSGKKGYLNEKKSKPEITDNSEDLKPINIGGFEFTKKQAKIACLIFTVEILLIFSTGPVIILWNLATKNYLGEKTMLKYSDDYKPIDKNHVPSFYKLVKVTYNNDNTVRSEDYYTWAGSIVTIDYKENKTSGNSGLSVYNILLGIFVLVGLALISMKGIIKELLPYGVIIFCSAFIIGAFRLSLDMIFLACKHIF